MVKLSAPIRLDDGTITTCAALLDSGKAIAVKVDKIESRRSASGYTTKYFVDLLDETGNDSKAGWEIGKTAYQSRMKIGVSI